MQSIETIIDSQNIQINGENFSFQLYSQNKIIYWNYYSHNLWLKQASSALLIDYPTSDEEFTPFLPTISHNEDICANVDNFNDNIGQGKVINAIFEYKSNFNIINSINSISCLWEIKIYVSFHDKSPFVNHDNSDNSIPYLTSQIFLENTQKSDFTLPLLGYAPIYIKEGGEINLNNDLIDSKKLNPDKSNLIRDLSQLNFYSNGWQSWSNNYILTNKQKWPSSPVKYGRINLENQDQRVSGFFQSEYHTVIYHPFYKTGLVMGFITLKDQFSRILMDPPSSSGTLDWLCAYSQTDGILLTDLNSGIKQSEIIMIALVPTPNSYEILSDICRIGGILEKARLHSNIIAGWCSWYYYYTKVKETDMIKNLEYFKKNSDIPIELIQLDDGYQTTIGDWGLDGKFNKKFPHGLKWLVDKIHLGNFKAGLWIAPFFSTKNSKFYQYHPEWALKDKRNKLIPACRNWGIVCTGIDLSRTKPLDYLRNWSTIITQEWGFDFLKIDFLYASAALNAQFKEKNYTRAQMIRRGVQAIRDGIGNDTFLLGCGAPLGPCVGLVDSMRIGMDVKEQWSNMDFLFYKIGKATQPSLKSALRSTIQRSYMHNTWWINDPDCVIIRQDQSKLTLDEVLLELTIFGLSGGQLLISDDETRVSKGRIELLNKILPPHTPSKEKEQKSLLPLLPIPLDMFNSTNPSIYARNVKTIFGYRHLCAIINWKRKIKTIKYYISNIMNWDAANYYSDDQKFIVFDYWSESFCSIFDSKNNSLEIEIPPHGCKFLNIIPLPSSVDFKANPLYFLTSSLHICQGAKELISKKLSTRSLTLSLNLQGIHNGFLYFLALPGLEVSCNSNQISSSIYMDYQIIKIYIHLEKELEIDINFK